MKFKVGDQVIVTSGKDKGKKSSITAVLPKDNKVVVEGLNMFVKHVKPQGDREGQRIQRERALDVAKVAILNNGKPDRIGYKVEKDGTKVRVYKKTGKVIESKKK
ncbi:MAG TPA: 50S ribosomal protein L24 [Vitreimonas sp.]|nr:50S ribosomal protein L24 [Vitreimonas sp.]